MRAFIRCAAGGCGLLGLVLGAACANLHAPLLVAVRADLEAAEYRHAYDAYSQGTHPDGALDKFLNLGLLAFEAGDYAAAQRAFEQAEAVADERLTKSVTQEAVALAVSDVLRPYAGKPFDLAMLHYYRALAFLGSGDEQGAVVEGRAMAHHLEVTARESRLSYRDDAFLQWFSGSLYQTAGQFNDAWISYRRARELYSAQPRLPEPSFLCALESGAAGAADEATGTKRFGAAGAATGTKRFGAAGAAADTADSGAAAAAPCAGAPRLAAGRGRVVVLCEAGQAPPILEENIVFPFLKTDHREWHQDEDYLASARTLYARGPSCPYEEQSLEYLLRVALPYYPPPAPRGVTRVTVLGGGGLQVEAELAQDVGGILRQDLRDREGTIVVRAIARALIKYAAKKGVEKQVEHRNDWTRDVLPWLVNVAGVLTESADTRSWETLPDRIYAADFDVAPGDHCLSAVFEDGSGRTILQVEFPSLSLQAGETVFLRARCPDAAAP